MSTQTATKAALKALKALHPSRIDLSEPIREEMVERLNRTLSGVLDLKTHVKQAHWNVKGKDFYQLHELFDLLAAELETSIDLVAERVTALGGTALGTVRQAAQSSLLMEYPSDIFDGLDHIRALAERYTAIGKHVRESIQVADEAGDADTADLYTQISRGIDQRLWFLEAHLQG
jgi:starvation-inducible DNA-binding protein